VLLQALYAGGLRISEVVARSGADVLPPDDRVQLGVTTKGDFVRAVVSKSLLALRS
jgi:hypothetical protein